MEFTLTFFELVFLFLRVTAPIWLLFILLVVVLGQIAGRFENWQPLSALLLSAQFCMAFDKDSVRTVIFEANTPAGKAFDVVLIVFILLSVLAVMLDSVAAIHAEGRVAAPHITCVDSSREQINALLDDYAALGIRHLLALRGDLPSGVRDYGNRVGVWRMFDCFDRHEVKCTVSLNFSVWIS